VYTAPMANRTWKVVGINFDHMHMGDLLRMAHEHPDAARLAEPLCRLGEMLPDLTARCALIEPRVLAVRVDAILAERERIHTVVRRRRVQPHERIRVQPVAARRLLAIHHDHLGVRLGHERVGKRQAAGPGGGVARRARGGLRASPAAGPGGTPPRHRGRQDRRRESGSAGAAHYG